MGEFDSIKQFSVRYKYENLIDEFIMFRHNLSKKRDLHEKCKGCGHTHYEDVDGIMKITCKYFQTPLVVKFPCFFRENVMQINEIKENKDDVI